MKTNYPMEAFALAMVVFSLNMQEAMITGIILLLITVLGFLFDQFFGRKLPAWSRKLCMVIILLAVTYSLFQVIILGYFKGNLDQRTVFLQLAIGALIAKHVLKAEEINYSSILYESAFSYGALILIAVIREFLSYGTIYDYKLTDADFLTSGFQNVILGFLMSAIAIAVLNRIFRYEDLKTESLWVILPVILVNQPFSMDLKWESIGVLVSIAVAILFVYSVRMFLIFSNVRKEWKRLPIELVSVSIIYLTLMVF